MPSTTPSVAVALVDTMNSTCTLYPTIRVGSNSATAALRNACTASEFGSPANTSSFGPAIIRCATAWKNPVYSG